MSLEQILIQNKGIVGKVATANSNNNKYLVHDVLIMEEEVRVVLQVGHITNPMLIVELEKFKKEYLIS